MSAASGRRRLERVVRCYSILWVTVVLLLAACGAAAQPSPAAAGTTPIALVNPGFESRLPDAPSLPAGWEIAQHAGATSYEFTLDGKIVHNGKQSLRIDNVGSEPYGMVSQELPVGELRGKTLRLSAYLRTRDVTGNRYGRGAALVLQALVQGSPLAFNHMRDAPARGTTEWTRHEVTLAIPPQTQKILVGAMLTGPGTVWLDDVALEVLPPAP